jgi:hypothetical protein
MLDDLAAGEVVDSGQPLWAQPLLWSAGKHVASSLGSFKTALSCAVVSAVHMSSVQPFAQSTAA